MRKRVLLAEQSDTIRSMVESVLRQAGLEVISVAASDKATEVLSFSRPDLLIVSADLKNESDQPFYESMQDNPKSSSIPLLILKSPDDPDLPYPDEVIINKPVDPKELLDKVNVFAGSAAVPPTSTSAAAVENGDLDDSFLDAALGLGQLEVTASEDMNQTRGTTRARKKKPTDKMIGFDHEVTNHVNASDSGRVEALHIRDEAAEISADPQANAGARPPMPKATGKIEILDDQFGMKDPNALKTDAGDDHAHDYNWFVDSMRDEIQAGDTKPKPAGPDESQGLNLNIAETSSMVSPVTPGPPQQAAKTADADAPGVDKFIEEFKKEIENIRTDEPASITINEANSAKADEIVWEESMEKVSPDQINLFTRELITELASQIARRIADKIDGDKLMALIKNEIAARATAPKKK